MTYNYNKDNSTGNPFQITKNLIKKDEGNLFVVGGTENEVFSLIVSSLLSANGSYLVWDPDCSIYKNTAEKMKEKGYSIYNTYDTGEFDSFINFFVYSPKLFLESLSVVYVHDSDLVQLSSLIKYLMDNDYRALYGQHLTILIGCLEKARLEPEFAWWLKKCKNEHISVVLHADVLLPECFHIETNLKILKCCKYNLFLDNKCDASISYLNKILPVFASCKDIYFADLRDEVKAYVSTSADVKVLEGFRDMDKEDCLFVEDGNSFIFDNKKNIAYCAGEASAKLNIDNSQHEGLDIKKNIIPAALAAVCGCIVFYALKKRKK